MSKIAFVFPGQGSQYIGMGKDICQEYSSARNTFKQASDSLGFDVEKMVFDGDEETLKITENTQPTMLTASIACLQPLIERGLIPDMVAGLSLGEYSAHVVANTFDFKEAVSVVKARGKYMQEAVPFGVGTMAAILGLENEIVIECCKEASLIGIVSPANFNCPGQVVVAGEVKAVERLVELAKGKGAKRAIMLPVSAPFHCIMLKSVGEKLSYELDKITFKEMKYSLVTNVTAKVINDKNVVKDLLIRQVSSSVLWEGCVNTMLENGIDTFVEIGPGKTLSGFIKKISKDIRLYNVEDLESLNKTMSELL